MKTALLVDTGFSALPIFEALKKLGLTVHVVGSRPSDALVSIADDYHCLDYADVDAMKELIDEHQFDYLVPGCTDKSYQVCSEIGSMSHRGIDTPSATAAINDKELFREMLLELAVPAPRTYKSREAIAGHDHVIVKPVDSYSGRGITVVKPNLDGALERAIKHATKFSNTGRVVIQDYVEGQLYSYSCFIESGAIKIGFFVQEDCKRTGFSVDTSALCCSIPSEVEVGIKGHVHAIVDHLNLEDGLLHLQFILQEDNSYSILEATRRCPGDLYSILIELSTGFEYARAYVSAFVGPLDDIAYETSFTKKQVIRHTLSGIGQPYFSYWSNTGGVRILRCYPVVPCCSGWNGGQFNRCAIIFVEPGEVGGFSAAYAEISGGGAFQAH